mmetsp:Transcript_57177/g.118703  ORF Transcript_57177/g.118703 Transcript_57177/m.118703 type:complete len:269 (+) Transcript_57177:527-1333(+)
MIAVQTTALSAHILRVVALARAMAARSSMWTVRTASAIRLARNMTTAVRTTVLFARIKRAAALARAMAVELSIRRRAASATKHAWIMAAAAATTEQPVPPAPELKLLLLPARGRHPVRLMAVGHSMRTMTVNATPSVCGTRTAARTSQHTALPARSEPRNPGRARVQSWAATPSAQPQCASATTNVPGGETAAPTTRQLATSRRSHSAAVPFSAALASGRATTVNATRGARSTATAAATTLPIAACILRRCTGPFCSEVRKGSTTALA